MAEPEWTVLAEAGRVYLLEATGVPGEPPRLLQEVVDPQAVPKPGEPSGEPMQRLARQVADLLEQAYAQARFEFLRIAVEPRFEDVLRAEIARRLDLHRAVIEWRVLAVVPPAAAVVAATRLWTYRGAPWKPSISTCSSRRQIAACSTIRGASGTCASSAAATVGRSAWSRTYTLIRLPGPKCGGNAGRRVRAASIRLSKLAKVSASCDSRQSWWRDSWPTTLAVPDSSSGIAVPGGSMARAKLGACGPYTRG